jgi:hypothetical protein
MPLEGKNDEIEVSGMKIGLTMMTVTAHVSNSTATASPPQKVRYRSYPYPTRSKSETGCTVELGEAGLTTPFV